MCLITFSIYLYLVHTDKGNFFSLMLKLLLQLCHKLPHLVCAHFKIQAFDFSLRILITFTIHHALNFK